MTRLIKILACVALGGTLAGCATLREGGGIAGNPLVQGVVHIASRAECAAYAEAHPEDAAVTADYLRALSAATEGCLAGMAGE